MPKGKRLVTTNDRALFWQAMSSGVNMKESARMAGISYSSATKWVARAKKTKAEMDLQDLTLDKPNGGADKISRIKRDLVVSKELPPVVPPSRLSKHAARGLEDFDYFRMRYLGRVPSNWQVDAAYKIVAKLESEDKEFLVLNCPPGAGKALALGTPLRTPDGWTTIRDVRIGDFVLGAYGQPVRVIAKSEVFTDHDCYTVTSDDGWTVVADGDHLWDVRLHGEGKYKRTSNGKGKRGPVPRGQNGVRTQTTRFLAQQRSKRPELALTKPVHGVGGHLLVDPYVLGVWLGDGASADGRIACHENDQPEIRGYFERAGYKTVSKTLHFGTYGLKRDLRKLGVLNNKHVPDVYLNAMVADRLALLQGLIDSDGYVSEKGSVEFCSTNPLLMRAVRDLVLGMGVKCSVSESRAMLYGKDCGPKWRVTFYMKDCARLTRKRVRSRDGVRTANRYLTVTACETVPTQCIQVEGDLFLAGEGLLLTHNSTLFHDVAVWCIVRNRAIRVMIGSISQTLAKMYSRRIRETLERTSPLQPDPEMVRRGLAIDAEACLALDFGRFKPTNVGALWRAEEFIVEQYAEGGLDNKEPTVSAYGIESEFIGHRADLCLFDDVASPENARESTARDKLLERWDSMAEARVEPGGVLAVIGQRLGPQDLYAHCLSKVTYEEDPDDYDGGDITGAEEKEPIKRYKYDHIVYKAYYEELDTGPESRRVLAPAWPHGPLLEPFRLSWKDLSYIRHSSPTKFQTIYQQQDIQQGYYLIERVWATGGRGPDGIDYPGCIDQDRRPGYIPEGLEPPIISVCSVDPSPTMFWAVQWWLYQPKTNLRYLVDVERVKLTAEELLGWDTATASHFGLMEDWQNRSWDMGYPISHWIVEINAAQRFLLAHDFVRKWQARQQVMIVPHTTNRNKLDDDLGVEALLPQLWRSGAIRLPSMRDNWKTLAFVDEMSTWTRDKKSGTDLVMAHWFAELHMPGLSPFKAPPRLWRPSWI